MAEIQEVVLALTTEADAKRAERLAQALLDRHLVACVNLVPIRSLYRWNGEQQLDAEVQLLLKTTASRLQALQVAVMELHSYETPEWVTWPVQASAAYGQWVRAELS